MPAVVQACIVVLTLAVVAFAIATIRIMSRLDKSMNEFSALADEVRHSLSKFQQLTHEVRGMVGTLSEKVSDTVTPLRRAAERFEHLADRTARLSSAVLDEVERPVSTAVALARGVRLGTTTFLGKISERLAHRRSATNGGMES